MGNATIIQGKAIAEEIQKEIKEKISLYPRPPGLGVLLVGDHPPSRTYVEAKKRACASVGISFFLHECKNTISQAELIGKIEAMNCHPEIDGILLQLPLPGHLDVAPIIDSIHPMKDVDGLHPINLGKLLAGRTDGFIPCTPLGIKVLLQRSHIATAGKHVVILGRSAIVGKPLAALMMQKGSDATVTVAHSQTKDLQELSRSADILVAAIGSPGFVNKEMVKEGAVVIDVGINRIKDDSKSNSYKIVGDVDFNEVSPIASFITPVPQGVGPMTIAMLLQNTLHSLRK